MHQDFIALYERWREKADLFRQHGHEATARTYEVCSGELERALREGVEQLLDLQQAAREALNKRPFANILRTSVLLGASEWH